MFGMVPWRKKSGEGIEAFRREVDNLFDSFLSKFPATQSDFFRGGEWYPRIDVSEVKDRIIVKAEIPGMELNNVSVHFKGDILTIEGEKEQETEDKDDSYHLVERHYGRFRREIELPAAVAEEKISATYKNGVLRIELPKIDREKKEQVKIKVD